MDLKKACRKGRIDVDEFFGFVVGAMPRRTYFLEPGDYVVFPCMNRPDLLEFERIAKLDYPEKGDFETVRGSTGPIRGNVFVKFNNPDFPRHLLIEGDDIGEPGCPTPVYDLVNAYLESRCRQN